MWLAPERPPVNYEDIMNNRHVEFAIKIRLDESVERKERASLKSDKQSND